MQATLSNRSFAAARAPRRAAVVCRAEMVKPVKFAGAAMASVAAAALLSSSAMALPSLPKFDGAALQERSDRTFQEINSSTSKTGNDDSANQMRPDLQKSVGFSKDVKSEAKQGLQNLANKASNAADKAVDKVAPGNANLSGEGGIRSALDNQAERADAVGQEAFEKTKAVFNNLGLSKN